ncbi:MAG TPA: DUF4160 domain-containing protein [Thermoanaerobaculia bacterium]|nr:DUF4160 domain-containing protein [Thermoanaerobaculia bacterium]
MLSARCARADGAGPGGSWRGRATGWRPGRRTASRTRAGAPGLGRRRRAGPGGAADGEGEDPGPADVGWWLRAADSISGTAFSVIQDREPNRARDQSFLRHRGGRHHLPHFHARYQEDEAVYAIEDLRNWTLLLRGATPTKIPPLQ